MGLIKVILVVFFIYYVFKFFARLLAPFLIKKVADKMQQKAEERFGNFQRKPEVKEGETIIDRKPNKTQKTSDDIGDYVEFEEIE